MATSLQGKAILLQWSVLLNMKGVTFDKLYDNYNVLSDAKDKISQHSKEYLEAIESTKGGEREKKLATQIISKFFKHFPSLQADAVEAIFDVCEDSDTTIRIAAMKSLVILCKDNKEHIAKIANILAQLLQVVDSQEFNVANGSLLQILKLNPMVTIRCIFKQINEGSSIVREKCIKFLITKVKGLDKSILTHEVEDMIITETKSVLLLEEVAAQEYIDLMSFLISTQLSHTFTGQQELVEIAVLKAALDTELEVTEEMPHRIDRLLTCIKFVLPMFSAKVESTKFVMYICDQVLPKWDKIAELSEGDLLQLAILRQLAELSTHCGQLDNASLYVVQIYQKLKDYMPPPPENTDVITMPPLDFTVVECLLYSFHRLARQCPDFLTHDPQVLKDFRSRLTYFLRGAQACSRALNNFDIKDKTLSDEDIRKKKIAPKLLDNINNLIKDLFYQPPKYRCNITLSFKIDEATVKKLQDKMPIASKRHIPITFETNGSPTSSKKQSRSLDSVELYSPPSGKFSNNFQSYESRNRGWNTRGGRGRGRNFSRSWRNK